MAMPHHPFTVDEFPGCCGLKVLDHFMSHYYSSSSPLTAQQKKEFNEKYRQEFKDKLIKQVTTSRDGSREGLGFIATLNNYQYEVYGDIFHECGWKMVLKNGLSKLHGRKIYVFMYLNHKKENEKAIIVKDDGIDI